MRIVLVVLTVLIIMMPLPLMAQTQLAVLTGITSSFNMGEIVPAPIFTGTFTVGQRFRLENGYEFSSVDKYTHAGWYLRDYIDILIFPSDSGFFLVGGVDYVRRNGGNWTKDGIKIELGGGYEKQNTHHTQYRFYIKKKVMSRNDDVRYSPYFELLARDDYSLGNTHWRLRIEARIGIFRYMQSYRKFTAFYSSVVVGFVYKWL